MRSANGTSKDGDNGDGGGRDSGGRETAVRYQPYVVTIQHNHKGSGLLHLGLILPNTLMYAWDRSL